MPFSDAYAKYDFTHSDEPETRYKVIVKVPKAEVEELRQDSSNEGIKLFYHVGEKVLGVLNPTDARFSIDCSVLPQGEIPPEVDDRPPDSLVGELAFWTLAQDR
jgi:hypothetical protein